MAAVDDGQVPAESFVTMVGGHGCEDESQPEHEAEHEPRNKAWLAAGERAEQQGATNAMISSQTKLTMKGTTDGVILAGSSLVAFIHGLLISAPYQTAPNSHAATAAMMTASQFTIEKSMMAP